MDFCALTGLYYSQHGVRVVQGKKAGRRNSVLKMVDHQDNYKYVLTPPTTTTRIGLIPPLPQLE